LWREEKRKGGESIMPIIPKVVYTGQRQVESIISSSCSESVGDDSHHLTDLLFEHAYVA